MTSLSDAAVASLRSLVDWPDLEGTKYEIRSRIGLGGMGTVYLALDAALNREVAIKVLSAPDPKGPAATRLAREARILAGLEHPGLVPVHDVGVLSDGRPYYVMKLVRGTRLDAYLERPLNEAERLRIFARIAETVAFAHAGGVVHRDLKPENIMIGAFGEVLVMDWGLARSREERGDAALATPVTTQPGAVLGTAGFMAPEMAAGRADTADERTDVYALGAILQILVEAGETVRSPRPLAAITLKAQSTAADDRYPTVDALMTDVERYRGGEPVLAYHENVLERGVRVVSKNRTAVVLVVAYIVARLALIAIR